LSSRASKPFVEVNCGAIPENLVESELFGYEPGAFTGSNRSGKKGQIELAHGGTLFLDEISELSLSSQVKLLKFLDDKVVSPLGGAKSKQVDVRILAATNGDLHHLAKAGRFRNDLLYRLEVIPLLIPPLRERRDEIIPLAESFLAQFNREFGEQRTISAGVLGYLNSYDFPGNVRELKNLIARLVMTAKSREISLSDLPERIVYGEASDERSNNGLGAPVNLPMPPHPGMFKERVEEMERQILQHYVGQCRSTHEIAKAIGIHHTSVMRKLKKYQIQLSPQFRRSRS
jgi:TyrR family helix-turn-helix protein